MPDEIGFVADAEDIGFQPDDSLGFQPDEGAATPSLRPYIPALGEDVQARPAPTALDVATDLETSSRTFTEQTARGQERSQLTPAQTERLDRGDLASALTHPPPGFEAPTITREQVLEHFPTMTEGDAGVLAGVLQTAAGAWNLGASPAGAAMAGAAMLGGPIGAGALGAFALEAAAHLPDASEALSQAVANKDPEAIARTASALALQASVLLGSTKGAQMATERAPATPRAEALEAPKSEARVEASTDASAPQALGIAPPESTFLQRVIQKFTPPRPTDVPALRIDKEHILPRLQDYATEKLMATSPEGMGRVPVLGALVDPRATVGAPDLRTGASALGVDAAIITRAHSVNKGRNLAALWAESQFRNRDVFRADETGTIPLTNNQRGYISDVIEAEMRDPGSQAITPQQRSWINDVWKPLREDLNRMLEEEGVREVVLADEAGEMVYTVDSYFPRPAIGKRGVVDAKAATGGGGRPGAKAFSEKPRYFETEFEGARPPQAGEQKSEIIYDPDAISRVTKLIVGGYKAVADHRLANDPALGAQNLRKPAEVVRETLDTIDFESGAPISRSEVAKELEAQLTLDNVYGGIRKWGEFETAEVAPAFRGKVFPIETAKRLRTAYADDVRGWVKAVEVASTAGKAMKAALDNSAPLVQGAAMMGSHPILWARTTLKSYMALLDPDVRSKQLELPGKRESASSWVQSGGSLLRLDDFLQSGSGGSLTMKGAQEALTALERKAPQSKAVARTAKGYLGLLERTGQAYGTFLDLAKLEMWDALRPLTEPKEWPRLVEAIENSLFTGRMESIGLNPHRALGERVLMFASSYYRGAGNLLATALQKGVSGNVAKRALTGYATAGLLMTFAGWSAAGLGKEEMLERLDPRKSKFMKVPVQVGDGTRIEVGVGNILTQLVRLIGQGADYALNDKPVDTGVEGNPYLRFMYGRSAVLPSLAFEILNGRDFLGNDIGVTESVARRFIPMAGEALYPREEGSSKPQRVIDAAFSFAGLNAFPESEYATQLRKLDEFAEDREGRTLYELPLTARARALQAFKQSDDYKKREPTSGDMRRFQKLEEQRRLDLRERLSDEARATLDKLGLSAGSYNSTVTLGGVDVPLSHMEQKRYEELLAESFNTHLKALPKEAEQAPSWQREKWWSDFSAAIRKGARVKLMQEIEKAHQR